MKLIYILEANKICSDSSLSNLNFNNLGLNINKVCELNFKINCNGSKKECLENLCTNCCKNPNGKGNNN